LPKAKIDSGTRSLFNLKSIYQTQPSLGSRQEPGHIEITNRIAGIEFEDAYKRVQVKEIDGIEMKFIHFNDLIRNKLASARPKDLDDVENLNRINKKSS
jgi:hypothetical protein